MVEPVFQFSGIMKGSLCFNENGANVTDAPGGSMKGSFCIIYCVLGPGNSQLEIQTRPSHA